MSTPRVGAHEDTYSNVISIPENSGGGSKFPGPKRTYNPNRPTPNIPAPKNPTDGLDLEKRNAYELVLSMFKEYGLESLAPQILKMVQGGYDSATISNMLQETPEYKKRFAANELRKKAGLSVLSPAEYIQQERSYRQILESNGLPKGFYDSPDDFTKWIADDVSPNELNERAQDAAQAVASTDQYYLKALRNMGLGQGDLTAAMLDRSRALPILQQVVKSSQIAAEAYRNNLTIDQARATYFAGLGVTQDSARQAYQQIGDVKDQASALGNIFGEAFGQTDLEDELLGGSGLASQKRKRLAARETGEFAGSGTGTKSTTRETSGQF